MKFGHVAAFGLTVGMIAGAPALAKEASVDGTWKVKLVTEAGSCDSVYSQTVAIQNGQVRPLSGDATISGGVSRDGSVALTISQSLAQASATGASMPSGDLVAGSLRCSAAVGTGSQRAPEFPLEPAKPSRPVYTLFKIELSSNRSDGFLSRRPS
jgi:hypothetical protein